MFSAAFSVHQNKNNPFSLEVKSPRSVHTLAFSTTLIMHFDSSVFATACFVTFQTQLFLLTRGHVILALCHILPVFGPFRRLWSVWCQISMEPYKSQGVSHCIFLFALT